MPFSEKSYGKTLNCSFGRIQSRNRLSTVFSKMKVKNPQIFVVKLTALILLALALLVMFDFIDDSFLDQALPHTPIHLNRHNSIHCKSDNQ